ncbi:hypothetical protein C8J56DRAFT_62524 [Mycena floridula]|nr:hypothetical protein C8J56DRAFT_62524 [Mycena floridula]
MDFRVLIFEQFRHLVTLIVSERLPTSTPCIRRVQLIIRSSSYFSGRMVAPTRQTLTDDVDFLTAAFLEDDSIEETKTTANDDEDWLSAAFLEDDSVDDGPSTNLDDVQPLDKAITSHGSTPSSTIGIEMDNNGAEAVQRCRDVLEPLYDSRSLGNGLATTRYPQGGVEVISKQVAPGRVILPLPQRCSMPLSAVNQRVVAPPVGLPPIALPATATNVPQGAAPDRVIRPLPRRAVPSSVVSTPVDSRFGSQNPTLQPVEKKPSRKPSKRSSTSKTVVAATPSNSVQPTNYLLGSNRYPLVDSQPRRYHPGPLAHESIWPPYPSTMSFQPRPPALTVEEISWGYCLSKIGPVSVISIDEIHRRFSICKWGPEGACGKRLKVKEIPIHIRSIAQNGHHCRSRHTAVCQWDGCQKDLGVGNVMAHVAHVHLLDSAAFCIWCHKLLERGNLAKVVEEHRCTPGKMFKLPNPGYVL